MTGSQTRSKVRRVALQVVMALAAIILLGIEAIVAVEVLNFRGTPSSVVLGALAAGFVLGSITGAFVLCSVAGTYNQFRVQAQVPPLELPRGMLTVFTAGFLTLGVQATALLLVGIVGHQLNRAGMHDLAYEYFNIDRWNLRLSPVMPLVYPVLLGVLLSRWLPTTFRRAMIIVALYVAVWILVGVFVLGVWLLIGGDFRS